MSFVKRILVFICCGVVHFQVYGQHSGEHASIGLELPVDDFISISYTPTYDCPSSDFSEKIEAYLAQDNLSVQQKLTLTSRRTHSLICAGEQETAKQILQSLLNNDDADKKARYYLSAIYQFGFLYDIQEDPQRCDYYALARDSAKDKFADIHLSGSLGFITECMQGQTKTQLFGLYDMLESVAKMNDKAALANAYSRIGSFYAGQGQQALAAMQYLLAYEAGKDSFTDENNLNLLSSALSSLVFSHDLEKAKEILPIYIEINKNVNTTRSNFMLYLNQSIYYLHLKQYDQLKLTLANWSTINDRINNPIYKGLYRWYQAEICHFENDLGCLEAFVQYEKTAADSFKNYIAQSPNYLKFRVKLHIALNNHVMALEYLDKYEKRVRAKSVVLQDFDKNVDITDLHKKISNLESTLIDRTNDRNRLFIVAGLVLALMLVCLIWFIRRNYQQSNAFDSLTGFLNQSAIKQKLNQLPAPGLKRMHALAIFDVSKFSKTYLNHEFTTNDVVLYKVAETLRKITRNADLLGRFGSKQLILCLTDIEESAAQAFFERVKLAMLETFKLDVNFSEQSIHDSMSVFYSSEKFGDIDEVLSNMLLSLDVNATHD